MALQFPNQSRSFDKARHAVRFSGYDGMFEVPFLVDAAALTGSAEATEKACLLGFDAMRDSVHEVARRVYARARRTIYFLTLADFK